MRSRCSDEAAGSLPGQAGGQLGTGGQRPSGGRPRAARAEAGPGHSNPGTPGSQATRSCLENRELLRLISIVLRFIQKVTHFKVAQNKKGRSLKEVLEV